MRAFACRAFFGANLKEQLSFTGPYYWLKPTTQSSMLEFALYCNATQGKERLLNVKSGWGFLKR